MLGSKIFINMKIELNEAMPSLIPEFPVEIAGHHLTLRFDVNINKTKKGVKLQFVMKDVPTDPTQAQQMANEIGTELQEKFGESNLQIIYDVENPYRNVIGFLVPLPSIANYLMKNVFKGGDSTEEPTEEPADEIPAEEPQQDLPAQELPPSEEPIRERLMRIAGLR